MRMENVMNILIRKQPYFNTISPSSTLGDALSRMSCENTDHLIVMENDQFLGVLTEHDITSKVMFNSRPLHQTSVKEMMNTHLPVANSDATVEGCIRLMRQFNVRYVPVFENYHFCGVVSSDDILQEAVYHRDEIFDEKAEKIL